MDRPQWVIFDAVGTLITPDPNVADAYAAVGRRYGVSVPVDVLRQRFRLAFRDSETTCFGPERRGRTSEFEEMNRWRWIVGAVLPEATNAEACFQDLWDHFAASTHWRCYDDVPMALAQLRRRGIDVAIASNFDQRLHGVQEGIPELSDIVRVFVSSALGARKPDPQFYRRIEAELSADPRTLLMVGDDPECDVTGPRQCGWQAQRLHRSTTPDRDSWGSLHDLVTWLDHMADA